MFFPRGLFILVFIILSSLIHKRQCRTVNLNPSPEQDLIHQLIDKDNEVTIDNVNSSENETSNDNESNTSSSDQGQGETVRRVKKKVIKLPSYLIQMKEWEDEEEEEEGEDGQDQGHHHHQRPRQEETLARVWLPMEIQEQPSNSTSIVFQQSQTLDMLGNFTKAEIVFTTKMEPDDENENERERNNTSPPLFLKLLGINNPNAGEANNENRISPQEVTISQRFYAFNITHTLLSHLDKGTTLEHPHKFYVDVQLLRNRNNEGNTNGNDSSPLLFLNLHEFFDLQVDRPFLLFSYREKKEFKGFETNKDDTLVQKNKNTISTKNRKRRRKRRSTPLVHSSSNSSSPSNLTTLLNTETPSHLCRRISWAVDPEHDLHWFDYFQPNPLELGFCAGGCPYPLQNDHFNYTLHTFFKDRHRIFKNFDAPKNLPRSCCVPISYKPARVWIFEEENSFVTKMYHDLVVDQCGCR